MAIGGGFAQVYFMSMKKTFFDVRLILNFLFTCFEEKIAEDVFHFYARILAATNKGSTTDKI